MAKHDFNFKLSHDESMRLAAAVIDLVKKHETTLHPALETDTTSAKDKVAEFLMVFAEEFDVSPDLVAPGQGYARAKEGERKRKRSVAADEFFATQSPRTTKTTKSESAPTQEAD